MIDRRRILGGKRPRRGRESGLPKPTLPVAGTTEWLLPGLGGPPEHQIPATNGKPDDLKAWAAPAPGAQMTERCQAISSGASVWTQEMELRARSLEARLRAVENSLPAKV